MNKHQSASMRPTITYKAGKRIVLCFLALAVILMSATFPNLTEEQKFTVVLDAGHGGSDPGNLGTGRYKRTEKDVTLEVTLQLAKYISENYPEVRIIFTRKTDTFPTLNRRVEIANESNADLFISIHCNANENKMASGSETFVMGLHKSEESPADCDAGRMLPSFWKKTTRRLMLDSIPKNPDTYIILSMRENAYLDKSIVLAKSVQDQFRTRVGRKDRGVKQAGYYVISFTNMPSILVELGFLTNEIEEDFLQTGDGKTYMASAIFRAFKEFKEKDDIKRGLKAAAKNKNPCRKNRTRDFRHSTPRKR